MKTTLFIVLASFAGAALGTYAYLTYKPKKKCSCAGDKSTAAPVVTEPAPVAAVAATSQPIAPAGIMNADGWGWREG